MNNITDALNGRGQMPLVLTGWDDYSVWGYDPMMDALFAQLWRNTDSSRDEPRIWISPGGRWPVTTDVNVLAGQIAEATSSAESDVRVALARCAPAVVKEHLLATA